MQARMGLPVMIIPAAGKAMNALAVAIQEGGVSIETLEMVRLRTSQINGCSICVETHARELRKEGASDDRIFAVAAWRDTSHFTDAERSALALGEAVTRMSDRTDPVPDEIWDAASRHYDQAQLATLLLAIAGTNFFNRLHNAVRTQALGLSPASTGSAPNEIRQP